MKQNETNLVPKSSEKFHCELCDYLTCRKSQIVRHCSTDKHKKRENETNETKMKQKSSEKFQCICGFFFNSRSTLWRHKQKCNTQTETIKKEEWVGNLDKDNFINYLVKENCDFKEMLLEQNKVIMKMCETNNMPTIYNNNSNNNNKSFNLNLFLNETCKDAMNITDFVNSLKIQFSDLENVGEVGFVNGITNIIVKQLKNMDVTQRPVHCTDAKREVLYVKDENKWEKEGEENVKLRKAIKHVAFKNTKMLPEFKKKYPDCGKSDSKYADQYNKLVVETMGGRGDNDKEKEDKIIKNIAKEVLLEKI